MLLRSHLQQTPTDAGRPCGDTGPTVCTSEGAEPKHPQSHPCWGWEPTLRASRSMRSQDFMFLSGDVPINMNQCSHFFGRGPDWQEDQSQCKGHCGPWGGGELCPCPAALSGFRSPAEQKPEELRSLCLGRESFKVLIPTMNTTWPMHPTWRLSSSRCPLAIVGWNSISTPPTNHIHAGATTGMCVAPRAHH